MQIIDLRPSDELAIEQVAALLVEAFKENWPGAWPNIEAAREEVHSSFAEDRISRVAVDESGVIRGWVGAIRQYDGRVWELHPIVVNPVVRRQGIGRALVADLENCLKERGCLTLWLGTDDENNQTTLSGINLYPNVCEHITKLRNLRQHPYEFYEKLGFVVVGVMPDANGRGKPDIYMAKSLHNS